MNKVVFLKYCVFLITLISKIMRNMQIEFNYLPVDFVLEIESNTSIQQIIQPKPKLDLEKVRLPLIENKKIQFLQQHTIMKKEKVKKYEIISKHEISTVFKPDITQCCLFKLKPKEKIKLMKHDIEMTFNENKKQSKAKLPIKKHENVLIFEINNLKFQMFEISGETREIKLTETVKFNMNNLKEYEEFYLTLKRFYRIEEIEEDSDLLFVINGNNYIKQSLSKLLYELENELLKRK